MVTRTVVKANYKAVRGAKGAQRGKALAKASARYYETRPDAEGEYQEREAFVSDESFLQRQAVLDKIDEAETNYLYRMVLSPGEDVRGDALEEWAREILEELEGPWVAYAHDDQTDHPHVHVLAFTDEKLDRDDFEGMREAGDLAYARVQQQEREWQTESVPDVAASRELDFETAQDLN